MVVSGAALLFACGAICLGLLCTPTTGTLISFSIMQTTRTRPTHTVYALYSYTVAGVTYTGNRVCTVPLSFGAVQANELCDGWRIGAPITVYYAPWSPGYAVLRRGGPVAIQQATFLGIALFIFGLGLYGRRETSRGLARLDKKGYTGVV